MYANFSDSFQFLQIQYVYAFYSSVLKHPRDLTLRLQLLPQS